MHRLPIQDSATRARLYREGLLGSKEWRSLKQAMDLWCACWFWPADELDCAPLPTTFADPEPATRAVANRIAAGMRFFHWELEFPDVFRATGSGFDAMLGNPPWDIAKPKSQEFFSNIDPLYRSYGKQEAVRRQKHYFTEDASDRAGLARLQRPLPRSIQLHEPARPHPSATRKRTTRASAAFIAARGKANLGLHDRWREARRRSQGYADADHSFRHQGSADLNLYKLFLEQDPRPAQRTAAGSASSSLLACTPTRAPAPYATSSWNAAPGSGCSASRTGPSCSRSTAGSSSTP